MKLLITSITGFYYLDDKFDLWQIDDCRCHGLTWDNNNIILGERYGGCLRLSKFDNKLKRIKKSSSIDCARFPHEVIYVPQKDRIYIVSTKNDTIVSCNSDFGDWVAHPKWCDEDYHHTNSIWFDGIYFWSVEHNGKLKKPSRIVKLDHEFKLVDSYESDWK
jgi:hypothetical protein